jgi:hypothetical protein
MRRGRTDLRPELTDFVRALRRRANRMRRRASHDKATERLCACADYLDAQARTLEATPDRSGPTRQRASAARHGRRLLPTVLAMLS